METIFTEETNLDLKFKVFFFIAKTIYKELKDPLAYFCTHVILGCTMFKTRPTSCTHRLTK